MLGILDAQVQLDDSGDHGHLRIVQIGEHRFRLYGCKKTGRLLSLAPLPDMLHVTTPLQAMSVIQDHISKLSSKQPKSSTYHQLFSQLQTLGWSNVVGYRDDTLTLRGPLASVEVQVSDITNPASLVQLYKDRLDEQQQRFESAKAVAELDALYITAPGPDPHSRYLMLGPGVVELVDCRTPSQTADLQSRLAAARPPLKEHAEGFECGICLALVMHDTLPDVACPCKRVYHRACWTDWAHSCQGAKRAFGFIVVACIFCGQDIEIKALK